MGMEAADPNSICVHAARRAIFTPGGGGGVVRSVWLVLHGYRQLADRFVARFEPVASPERLIMAPEGLNRFYLDNDASPDL